MVILFVYKCMCVIDPHAPNGTTLGVFISFKGSGLGGNCLMEPRRGDLVSGTSGKRHMVSWVWLQ